MGPFFPASLENSKPTGIRKDRLQINSFFCSWKNRLKMVSSLEAHFSCWFSAGKENWNDFHKPSLPGLGHSLAIAPASFVSFPRQTEDLQMRPIFWGAVVWVQSPLRFSFLRIWIRKKRRNDFSPFGFSVKHHERLGAFLLVSLSNPQPKKGAPTPKTPRRPQFLRGEGSFYKTLMKAFEAKAAADAAKKARWRRASTSWEPSLSRNGHTAGQHQ